jgi:hypothetical protein
MCFIMSNEAHQGGRRIAIYVNDIGNRDIHALANDEWGHSCAKYRLFASVSMAICLSITPNTELLCQGEMVSVIKVQEDRLRHGCKTSKYR